MTAGELLFEGEFDLNIPALKPVIAYAVDGGAGALKVSQASASGSYENSWRLSLSESTPIDLQVTFGAGPPQRRHSAIRASPLSRGW